MEQTGIMGDRRAVRRNDRQAIVGSEHGGEIPPESRGQPTRGHSGLNPETRWNDGIFRYHHDAVADEIILRVQVLRLSFRCDHGSVGNARVLVDDRAIDYTIATDPDGRSP